MTKRLARIWVIMKSVLCIKKGFLCSYFVSLELFYGMDGNLRHQTSYGDELCAPSSGNTGADWVVPADPGLQRWGLHRSLLCQPGRSQAGHRCSQTGCADVILDSHTQSRHQTFNYWGFMYNFIILVYLHVCSKTKKAPLSNPIKSPKPECMHFYCCLQRFSSLYYL